MTDTMTETSHEMPERKGMDKCRDGFARLTDSSRIEEYHPSKCARFGA